MDHDEAATMGTTGTPSTDGAAAAEEADEANGSAIGAATPYGTGGQLDDPALPYDHRPQPDDPVHRTRIS